ncbi:MAG: family 10 glycosylhydrolase [Thermosynechococcaceae cyanobacterium MS004]|nr:family 10 glycosylhydrolase [Thermosynechococcaceae cyanobacterium MS004]
MKDFTPPFPALRAQSLKRRSLSWIGLALFTAGILQDSGLNRPAIAQIFRSQGLSQPFCHSSPQAIAQKNQLWRLALQGDRGAQQQYREAVLRDAQQLQQCRAQSWLKNQAIWLRVHECDLQPGILEKVLDRIVSRGYNQINLEVFYTGQVLLPQSSNPTVWPSVVRNPAFARRDLMAETIQKGRERGLKVYAWMFGLNYGYAYSTRPERASGLARNGYGKISLNVSDASLNAIDGNPGDSDKVFVDPYNPQVRQDYSQLLQAVLQRQPDGVLFDYIRYPRQTGAASISGRLQDLWIFSPASQQALIARGTNQKGRATIQRYLAQGTLNVSDLSILDQLYPGEGEPDWQGRGVPARAPGQRLAPPAARLPRLRQDLWLLSAAHAYQGVVDFVGIAAAQVRQRGIPSGAVFFPDGNRRVGQGFDSRMQAWDRFPGGIEWHPMSYGICGDSSCIVEQARRVVTQAPPGTKVTPVIAGAWGFAAYNRPSLDAQTYAIRQALPQVSSISHFDFSWQEPQFSNARRSCRRDLIDTYSGPVR